MDKKSFLKKLAIILVYFILFCLIGETIIRYLNFGTLGLDYHSLNSIPYFSENHMVLSLGGVPLEENFIDGIPNKNIIFRGKDYTTNRWGLRDKDYSFKKSNNTFRLLVLGNSWTRGSGVDDSEVYTVLTEDYLNNELKTNVEILNFGKRIRAVKINSKSILTLLDFSPDLVLFQIASNNDCEDMGFKKSVNSLIENGVNVRVFSLNNQNLNCSSIAGLGNVRVWSFKSQRTVYDKIYPGDNHPNNLAHKDYSNLLSEKLLIDLNDLTPITYLNRSPIKQCYYAFDEELPKNFFKSFLLARIYTKPDPLNRSSLKAGSELKCYYIQD